MSSPPPPNSTPLPPPPPPLNSVANGGDVSDAASVGGLQFDLHDVVPVRDPWAKLPRAVSEADQRLAEFFGTCELFGAFSPSDCLKLTRFARQTQHQPGDTVFVEGDLGRELYLVLEGEVAILQRLPQGPEMLVVKFGSRSFFGEMAIIENAPRSATCRVIKPTTLVRLDQDALDTMLNEDADLLSNVLWALLRVLSRRVRETNEQLRGLMSGRLHESLDEPGGESEADTPNE